MRSRIKTLFSIMAAVIVVCSLSVIVSAKTKVEEGVTNSYSWIYYDNNVLEVYPKSSYLTININDLPARIKSQISSSTYVNINVSNIFNREEDADSGYLNVYGENCPTSMIFVNGDSLKNFYYFKFFDFHNLTKVSFAQNTKLDYITVENCDVTSSDMFTGVQMYDLYFFSCNYLKRIDVPNYIRLLSLEDCENVSGIIISENLNALYVNNSPLLTGLEIPETLECCNLYDVGITDISVPAACEDFVISSHDLKDAAVLSGREFMNDNMFKSCTQLETVNVPDGVTEIGESTFGFCFKLKEVELPESVSKIDRGAFIGSGIESIYIPEGVTSIEYATFRSCDKLEFAVLPSTLTRIDETAFDDCRSLTDVYFGGSRNQLNDLTVYNGWAGKTSKKTIEEILPNVKFHFAHFIKNDPEDFVGPVGSQASFRVETEEGEYTYQWQVLKNFTWADITKNGNSAEYVTEINSSSEGKKFRCVVTSAYGIIKTSNEAVLHIGQPIEISKQPVDFSGSIGSKATFTVGATGEDIKYQWQYKPLNGIWKNSNSTGYDTASMTVKITEAREGQQYRCIIKDKFGLSKTSDAGTIVLVPTAEITTQPSDFTGPVGSKAVFTIEATGENLTYTWQYYTGTTWKNSNSEGCNTPQMSIKVTSTRDGQKYRCIVKQGDLELTSKEVAIHVGNPVSIKTQPLDCYQDVIGSKAIFKVVAEGDELSYQWQYLKGKTWKVSTMTGATTDTISVKVTEERNGQQYRCVITDKYGNEVISDSAKIIIDIPRQTQILEQPADYTGKVGDMAVFTVNAVGITDLNYQWQYKTASGTWKNSTATGCNTASLSIKITEARDGQEYQCVITNLYGQSVTTSAASIKVKNESNPPVITSDPQNRMGVIGSTATFTVEASGEGLSYQWQYSKDGGNTWNNSSSAGYNTASISIKVTEARDGQMYRCVVTSDGVSATSDAATLYVDYQEDQFEIN